MWYNIALAIVLSLAAIGGLVVLGIFLYKTINKKGSCKYVSYSPLPPGETPPPNTKIQCGYISCTDANMSATLKNLGPGVFYLGPLNGQKDLYTLNENASVNFTSGSTAINVYYDSASLNTAPNFVIS